MLLTSYEAGTCRLGGPEEFAPRLHGDEAGLAAAAERRRVTVRASVYPEPGLLGSQAAPSLNGLSGCPPQDTDGTVRHGHAPAMGPGAGWSCEATPDRPTVFSQRSRDTADNVESRQRHLKGPHGTLSSQRTGSRDAERGLKSQSCYVQAG